jgi:hypothetical protein
MSYFGIKRNFYIKKIKARSLSHTKMGLVREFYLSAECKDRFDEYSVWKVTFKASLK